MAKIINYILRRTKLCRELEENLLQTRRENDSLYKENNNLEKMLYDLECKNLANNAEIEELNRKTKILERTLIVQIDGTKFLKLDRQTARRRFRDMARPYVEAIERLIELGYNPINKNYNGNYAFVSGKKIRALSEKAKKLFRCGNDFSGLLSEDLINQIQNDSAKDEVVVNIPIYGRLRKLRLKDVQIKPVLVADLTLGYIIDFKNIGRVEQLYNKINERLDVRVGRVIEQTTKAVRKSISKGTIN